MDYYHGSNEKFDNFDLSKSGGAICLTPHLEYAKQFGKYVYIVKVKDQEHLEYAEHMSNITFRSLENIEIVDILNNKTFTD